jgi:aspartyl/asparaginyl beta-hydroxylase (cupin superfamily)
MHEYGDDCPIANYSILAPNSVINRHTGIENRSGEFIRIHIPLIVPQGEIFFEVYGEEVRWDDIFAFNNQFVHSAHNYTDQYRLCFLIDIRRTRAGLPPGVPYDAISHLDEVMRKFQSGESLM